MVLAATVFYKIKIKLLASSDFFYESTYVVLVDFELLNRHNQ